MAVPVVSVVIPAYNRAAVVARALRSALGQTLADVEVVVVDDASTDATVAVVEAARQAPWARGAVRLVRHARNRGASAARNTGLAAARAPLVAFLDSDDTWHRDKLRRQAARFAEAPGLDALFTGFTAWVDGAPGGTFGTEPLPGDFGARLLVHTAHAITSTAMVRRAALRAVGGFDSRLRACEEWDLWLRGAQAGWTFDRLPLPLTRHHRAPGAARLSTHTATMRRGHLRFFAKHRAAIAAAGPRALGPHRFRIAKHHALAGDMAAARRWFAWCAALPGWRLRAAVHLLATGLGPAAYRALATLRRR
jgi:glycosyltransferase involved in cell wall biosynthesis